MTYAQKLSPNMKETIQPILDELDGLAESQTIEVSDNTSINKITYALYTHFAITEQKHYFRIKSISPSTIQILRLPQIKPTITRTDSTDITLWVRDNLLAVSNRTEALNVIAESDLSESEQLEALSVYDERLGEKGV